MNPTTPKETPFRAELSLFAHRNALVSVAEAAGALRISKQPVRAFLDTGEFLAISINDNPHPRRHHIRIQRFSVEAWFLERHWRENGEELQYAETPAISYWRKHLRARPDKNTGSVKP